MKTEEEKIKNRIRERAYRRKYPERVKASKKKWREKNRASAMEMHRKWRKKHPQNMRVYRKKERYKKKGLGFIPLNKWFKGAANHHIDKERVIYMPVKLHSSIKHSVSKNQNMDKINRIAFAYLKDAEGRGDADKIRK